MEAVDGNFELLKKEESVFAAKPRDKEGGVFESPTQLLETGKSSLPINRTLELFINKESATLAKPSDQKGGVLVCPTQPLVTHKSPLPISRLDRPPFVNLSNTVDSPMCTPLSQKPSWTRINRSSSESKETLKVLSEWGYGVGKVRPGSVHSRMMWLEDSGCRETVEQTWDRSISGSPMEIVVSKLGACQKSLLLKVAEGEATQGRQRFRRNRIVELRNSEGMLVSGEGNISIMVRDYYKNLFLSSRLSEVDKVVRSIKSVVTEDMNNSLISPFSQVEIEFALNQMAPLKALGPNGMPPIFFQKFWSDIGDDVVRAVLFCLNLGSLLSATASSRSYAWQSILKSRHLIEAGARWRVGDGHLVKIFIDKWLPNDGILSSSSGELHPEATVSELINQTSGWWNVQLIDRCFHPPDAARIKALPLCLTPQSDVLIWPLEKSGKYLVKTGYRLLCEVQDIADSSLQASTEERGFWKKLWKIQGVGKAGLTVALFATTAWSVWFHRNKTKLNENIRPLSQLAGFARDYIRDFKSLKHSSTSIQEAISKRWSPPAHEEWKINFDGAMFGESVDAGVRVVVRNSRAR
ncbi:hypothetical protein SO802_033680 [Lithocarpus litseifolius]|uniref:Reverse transcriptase n=1 Tax=Lithocarpus litseifolius TaxID=425828 RepID=A0AAW2BDQ6_9ROSI